MHPYRWPHHTKAIAIVDSKSALVPVLCAECLVLFPCENEHGSVPCNVRLKKPLATNDQYSHKGDSAHHAHGWMARPTVDDVMNVCCGVDLFRVRRKEDGLVISICGRMGCGAVDF